MTPRAKVDGVAITYPGTSQTTKDAEMFDDLLESHSAG
jgi:hypothetical protein